MGAGLGAAPTFGGLSDPEVAAPARDDPAATPHRRARGADRCGRAVLPAVTPEHRGRLAWCRGLIDPERGRLGRSEPACRTNARAGRPPPALPRPGRRPDLDDRR